jgi:hypothetical protein
MDVDDEDVLVIGPVNPSTARKTVKGRESPVPMFP